MGHIGFTPQFKKKFKIEGDSKKKANKLLKEAKNIEKAGAFSIVLECVNPKASKLEVKKAIQDEYKVKVNKVNIVNVKGKIKRSITQRGKISKKPNWKKAYVALQEGDRIEITQD